MGFWALGGTVIDYKDFGTQGKCRMVNINMSKNDRCDGVPTPVWFLGSDMVAVAHEACQPGNVVFVSGEIGRSKREKQDGGFWEEGFRALAGNVKLMMKADEAPSKVVELDEDDIPF